MRHASIGPEVALLVKNPDSSGKVPKPTAETVGPSYWRLVAHVVRRRCGLCSTSRPIKGRQATIARPLHAATFTTTDHSGGLQVMAAIMASFVMTMQLPIDRPNTLGRPATPFGTPWLGLFQELEGCNEPLELIPLSTGAPGIVRRSHFRCTSHMGH